MQRLIIASVVLVLPGMIGLLPGVGTVQTKAAELPVLESDSSSPSSGCVFLGIKGKYISGAKEVLNRINEIRYEACTAGNVRDPRNPSRFLKKTDYVPLKWSKALEGISRIRAAESSLSLNHARLNGKEIWSVSVDGIRANGEVLAWNGTGNVLYGVNQWYEEKADWLDQNGNVTGHYEMMINPDNTYVGVSAFCTENGAGYPNTTAGIFSTTAASLNQSSLGASGTIIQKLDVHTSEISSVSVSPVYKGETIMPEITLKVRGGTLIPVASPALVSQNSAVLSVRTNGMLSGVSIGKTDLKITIGSYSVTKTVSVECRHDYTLSDPDANNQVTGSCARCGLRFTAKVPSTFTLFWKNSTSKSNMYMSGVPTSNPVGSTLEACLHAIDGSEGFRDLIIESSNAGVVRVGDTSTKFKKLQIVGAGSATVTVYPKYNPKLKRTYTVNAGGKKSNEKLVLVFSGESEKAVTSSAPQSKQTEKKTVSKAANQIRISTAKVTLKVKQLKAKARKFQILAKDRFGAEKRFALDKKATAKKTQKYIKVSAGGTVTVKKGTPKGIYRFTVKVTAKGSKTYKASSSVKEIIIKVKK